MRLLGASQTSRTQYIVNTFDCQTTVMSLLERFYDPVAAVVDRGENNGSDQIEIVIGDKPPTLDDSNGVVLVDGIDIRTMDVKYLRSQIALVG